MSPKPETARRIQTKTTKGKHMEPTITQNSALYLAHRKVSKRRATLFRWLMTAATTHPGPGCVAAADFHGLIHRELQSRV
jgi:hypothetical protein